MTNSMEEKVHDIIFCVDYSDEEKESEINKLLSLQVVSNKP